MGLLQNIQNSRDNNIDISEWKLFPLNKLFNIEQSKGDNQAKKLEEGDIPLVSSGTSLGNGICKYIKNGDGKSELFAGNIITVDMFGKAYYQEKEFFAVSHGRITMLTPRFKMSKYVALFIVSVLDKILNEKYAPYGVMCTKTALLSSDIYLPALTEDTPDWEYMENYIKEMFNKTQLMVL